MFLGVGSAFFLVFSWLGYWANRTKSESELRFLKDPDFGTTPPGGAGAGTMLMAIRFPKRFLIVGCGCAIGSVVAWIFGSVFS